VVPWTHGIDRRLRLGNIHDARLAELCARYRSGGLRRAFRHRRRVRDALTAGPSWPYVNWFAALAAPIQSEGATAAPSAEAEGWASAGHV
jgi:hypothetical protein